MANEVETITFSCPVEYGDILRRWADEADLSISAVIRMLIIENSPSRLVHSGLMQYDFIHIPTTADLGADNG